MQDLSRKVPGHSAPLWTRGYDHSPGQVGWALASICSCEVLFAVKEREMLDRCKGYTRFGFFVFN